MNVRFWHLAVHSVHLKIVLDFGDGGSQPGENPMRWREFTGLFSSSAMAWPLTALAQQPTTNMPRVGWLVTGFPCIAPIFPRCVEGG
jgi:hypothetical protein